MFRSGRPSAVSPLSASAASAFLRDLEKGTDSFDNIPLIIRDGFRLLLSMLENEGEKRSALEKELKETVARSSEEVQQARNAASEADNRSRKLQAAVKSLQEAHDELAKDLRRKADAEAVDAAITRKAEKADLKILAHNHSELVKNVSLLHDRGVETSATLQAFQAQATSDLASLRHSHTTSNSTFATALASLEAKCDTMASHASLSATQEELSILQSHLLDVKEKLKDKADIGEVNEVLATKANKTTVAQALQQKVSLSRLPDLLSPLSSRINDSEEALSTRLQSVELSVGELRATSVRLAEGVARAQQQNVSEQQQCVKEGSSGDDEGGSAVGPIHHRGHRDFDSWRSFCEQRVDAVRATLERELSEVRGQASNSLAASQLVQSALSSCQHQLSEVKEEVEGVRRTVRVLRADLEEVERRTKEEAALAAVAAAANASPLTPSVDPSSIDSLRSELRSLSKQVGNITGHIQQIQQQKEQDERDAKALMTSSSSSGGGSGGLGRGRHHHNQGDDERERQRASGGDAILSNSTSTSTAAEGFYSLSPSPTKAQETTEEGGRREAASSSLASSPSSSSLPFLKQVSTETALHSIRALLHHLQERLEAVELGEDAVRRDVGILRGGSVELRDVSLKQASTLRALEGKTASLTSRIAEVEAVLCLLAQTAPTKTTTTTAAAAPKATTLGATAHSSSSIADALRPRISAMQEAVAGLPSSSLSSSSSSSGGLGPSYHDHRHGYY
jgi:hypothetical protein